MTTMTRALPRTGTVPVGRRFLFTERRRAALTVLGVAASLLLVLLLGGIFAGAIERVTFYIRTSPAAVFVSQAGVRTMHMSASALPADTAARLRAVPGVAWASPIGLASGSVAGPRGRQLTYLIGYDTSSRHGGPPTLATGRAPGAGEAVLDEQAADTLGVRLGDPVTVLGARLRVVGLSAGGSSITNTTVFTTAADFARIRGGTPLSYVLVGARHDVTPQALASRVRAAVPEATVQTREEFAASEARIVTDMSANLLRLMSTIGLLIALAVIALGLMTATLARLRDFAVLKALGAGTARLAATVAVQVVWTVALAVLVAAALGQLLSWVLPLAAPAVDVRITAAAVLQLGAGALAVGLLAALWPLRRIATLDAATAFRESR
ncbi:ABC transporter permease [Phycicoccus sp. SLBN-51]|uniref:ABC transporter permease n=1 Tax=Phycicoccus sp. SLBN-51 TaxID=2768447 RepID=UPI001152EECB|nr:ABC transporter permease [Phycicoccus sp. SLBN-51]TQJ49298.1 putative ABC transport system permease protein [Phycicoccus sp. SLBN-51]